MSCRDSGPPSTLLPSTGRLAGSGGREPLLSAATTATASHHVTGRASPPRHDSVGVGAGPPQSTAHTTQEKAALLSPLPSTSPIRLRETVRTPLFFSSGPKHRKPRRADKGPPDLMLGVQIGRQVQGHGIGLAACWAGLFDRVG